MDSLNIDCNPYIYLCEVYSLTDINMPTNIINALVFFKTEEEKCDERIFIVKKKIQSSISYFGMICKSHDSIRNSLTGVCLVLQRTIFVWRGYSSFSLL
jgi:hypothetical protein